MGPGRVPIQPATEADDPEGPDHVEKQATYPGEDTSYTSRRELNGWYMYSWASEVFATICAAIFFPVNLEQLARENGVYAYDRVTPCTASLNITSDPFAMYTTPNPGAGVFGGDFAALGGVGEDKTRCVVHFLGITWMDSSSFALYTFSISTFLQAVLVVSMSGAADYGNFRKTFLMLFSTIALTSTVGFGVVAAVGPSVYLLASLFAIFSNMFYGAGNVLLNAYLPVFVRNHPEMRVELPVVQSSRASTSASTVTESTPLINNNNSLNTLEEEAEKANRLAAHISSRGMVFGYIAALLLQATALGTIYFLGVDNPIALKIPIFLAATWWAGFMYPTVPFWLKPRPGPPLSTTSRNSTGARNGRTRRVLRYIGFGWKQIWQTILEVGRLREVRIYLISWFLLSDGVITMSALAIIYAKTSLQLTPAGLALISATALIMNALGAYLWPSVIAPRLKLSVVPTMKLLISLMACLPGYAMLGMIWPGIVDAWGWGGLTNAWELYCLAGVFGFLAGGVNVYGRAIFSELIPSGKESTFFSLYAITDKGSSATGPALTGLIISLTGNIRLAFMLVVVMFISAIFTLRRLDLARGKLDAEEVTPPSPVTLEEEGEGDTEGVGPELGGKEDSD